MRAQRAFMHMHAQKTAYTQKQRIHVQKTTQPIPGPPIYLYSVARLTHPTHAQKIFAKKFRTHGE